jgi:hypothetical protein
MPPLSVFGQVRGSNGFTVTADHLVEGTTMWELRIELLTKFARPAGTGCVETIDDGGVNMVHGKGSWGAKTDSPGYEADDNPASFLDKLSLC